MKKFLYLLRLALFIVIWLINFEAGNKTEWWVELIDHNGTITKVKRSEYLEYKEIIENPIQNVDNDIHYYYLWELDTREQMIEPYKPKIHYGYLYTIQLKNFIKYLNINENLSHERN